MKREDMIKQIHCALLKKLNVYPSGLAEIIMDTVDENMDPKYGGEHQSSWQIASGSACEWDKK